jgi:hypothetical protein
MGGIARAEVVVIEQAAYNNSQDGDEGNDPN